jgi:hypothetical protein
MRKIFGITAGASLGGIGGAVVGYVVDRYYGSIPGVVLPQGVSGAGNAIVVLAAFCVAPIFGAIGAAVRKIWLGCAIGATPAVLIAAATLFNTVVDWHGSVNMPREIACRLATPVTALFCWAAAGGAGAGIGWLMHAGPIRPAPAVDRGV